MFIAKFTKFTDLQTRL